MKIKIIALFLALLTLAAALLSCGGNDVSSGGGLLPSDEKKLAGTDLPVKQAKGLLAYKENAVPGGVFLFLLAQSKTAFLYSATGGTEDDPALWDETGKNGKTNGQTIFDETLDSALSILYYADVARERGLTLDESEVKEITASLDAAVANFGSRAEFNNQMLKYGVGYNSLRDFYKLEALAQKGAASVLDEGGTDPVTDREIRNYYKENFVTLKHIYFNTVYLDDEGKVRLDEAAREEKSRRADEILKRANAGKDLSEFADETDDGVLYEDPEGVTLPLGDLLTMYASASGEQNVFAAYYYLFSRVKGFAEAALAGKTGVVTRVDDENSGIFLVARVPLDMSRLKDYKDAIFRFVLRPQRMSETVAKVRKEGGYTIDEEALAGYSVKSAPVFAELAGALQ